MVHEAYCFYTLLDEDRCVVAFYIATKTMVNHSAQMGKHNIPVVVEFFLYVFSEPWI
jgi:hypothetical protein